MTSASCVTRVVLWVLHIATMHNSGGQSGHGVVSYAAEVENLGIESGPGATMCSVHFY